MARSWVLTAIPVIGNALTRLPPVLSGGGGGGGGIHNAPLMSHRLGGGGTEHVVNVGHLTCGRERD